MKKVVLFAVSAALVLAFASVGMAVVGHDVGHVGHVDTEIYTSIDPGTIIFSPDTDSCASCIISSSVTSDHINIPVSGTYTIIILAGVEATYDTTPVGTVTINVTGTGLNPDGILIQNHFDDYDFIEVVDGIATITDPSLYFSTSQVYLVNAEEETSGGGGGGGCNAGAVSPLMGLLALPLVWLLK